MMSMFLSAAFVSPLPNGLQRRFRMPERCVHRPNVRLTPVSQVELLLVMVFAPVASEGGWQRGVTRLRRARWWS